jgi:kumamolisin
MRGAMWLTGAVAGAFFLATFMPAFAEQQGGMVSYGAMMVKVDHSTPGGWVVVPESSLPKPPGRAHTHLEFVLPSTPLGIVFNCASSTSTCETPASLACVYRVVPQSNGCDPNIVTRLADGGRRAIGIVDAYHDRTALNDLTRFSSTFGLPTPKLKVVYCSATSCSKVTTPPPACQNSNECGWALEESLDMQAAHALAPHAEIILVEAFSDSTTDLVRAEDEAAQLVAQAGGGEVTNSWGGEDSSGENELDSNFVRSGVVFFASTGDHKNNTDPPWSPDIEYPSTSPDVVAVGGTQIVRNAGVFLYEAAWAGGGGGLSKGESRPSYQNEIANKVGDHRGVPDIAADASPESGLVIYCSEAGCGISTGFYVVGGTSLASPLMAAMTNTAGHFRTSSTPEHDVLYSNLGDTSLFNNITHGTCHNGPGGAAVNDAAGWTVCTGIGTPHGVSGL